MNAEEKALDSTLHVAHVSEAWHDDSCADWGLQGTYKLPTLALLSLPFLSFTHTPAHTLLSTLHCLCVCFFLNGRFCRSSPASSGEGPSITTITICTHFIKLISVRDQSAANTSPSWNLFFSAARLTMLPH